MSCKKCEEKDKALDDRNNATKTWIQSDTQCRAYANKIDKELEVLRPAHYDLQRRHDANLCLWEAREQEFITTREAKLLDRIKELENK